MKKNIVKKMTFASMIAAIYFVLCLVEGKLASGPVANVRFAEGLCVFAFFAPEVIAGATIGCFLYNLLFGFGIIDALVGTIATFIGTALIYLIGKIVKKDLIRLITFGLPLVLLNALLVPIVLIVSLDDLGWSLYWYEFLVVGLGEAIAVYVTGIPLYYVFKNVISKVYNR